MIFVGLALGPWVSTPLRAMRTNVEPGALVLGPIPAEDGL